MDRNLPEVEGSMFIQAICQEGFEKDLLLECVWKDSQNKQLKTVNVAIKKLKEHIEPKNDKNYVKLFAERVTYFAKVSSINY